MRELSVSAASRPGRARRLAVTCVLGASPVWVAAAAVAEPTIPEGWRHVAADEYSPWAREYYEGDLPDTVRADVNGDGTPDEAWLVISDGGDELALIVAVSRGENVYEHMTLHRGPYSGQMQMGVVAVPPGVIQTACGKGYGDCPENAPTEVTLATAGIGFFRFESARSVFHWNANTERFDRTWTSD